MAELLRLINPEAPPATDGFVMTETAQDIQRSLSLVRSVACGALTMVAAVPGAGKTRTTWHCKCTSRRVIYHAAVAAEGNVRGVAGEWPGP